MKLLWKPIVEKRPSSGSYLTYAPSQDPDTPLFAVVFWDARNNKWIGVVRYWAEAITHWAELEGPE